MLRLLLYSNEIDLAGLIYSSSEHHFAGDADRGIAAHRWPAQDTTWHIDEAIDAYEQVHQNLRSHDRRYPTAEYLRSVTHVGNIAGLGDMDVATAGSDHIVGLLIDDDPRPVFLQAWGGTNTIARALKSIEENHKDQAGWDTLAARVSAKTVITGFGFQDETFDSYIEPTWPAIEHRQVSTSSWGYPAWDVLATEDLPYLGASWTRENVSNVGPMGAAYRVWGDGKQMAEEFDDEDYFGIAGQSDTELQANGYKLWCPVQETGSWISEGDSSNFALLIDNGLRSWEHPSYGGWGGRQAPVPQSASRWDNENASDQSADGSSPADYHTSRWFGPIQHDFAARLQWSITEVFGSANHHPILTVSQGPSVTARAGSPVYLDATASDPDGDDVAIKWWHYLEAGSYRSTQPVSTRPDAGTTVDAIKTATSSALDTPGPQAPRMLGATRLDSDESTSWSSATVNVPPDAKAGDTIHVIAEATDNGTPALTRYARVVVTVM